MKRIYHRFDLWEDYKFGMWRKVSFKEEKYFLDAAIVFTGDAELYGKYMIRAINEWPYGCEHNLSCTGMNRQAWIGHAATCIAIGCPEYITRLAWHQLTQEQQDRANAKADIAIKIWEDNYAKDKDWNRRTDSRPSQDFMDVRHIRENIPFFQCREGQYGNVALGSNGGEKKKKDRIAATIRHNRARGKHKIDAMSEIVLELKRRNWSDKKIGQQLGMDPDEVLRLAQVTGLAEMFADRDFSEAWEVDKIDESDTLSIQEENQ